MALNKEKLKTLVHYVAYRFIHEPQRLDPVKLNKVAWFADMAAYIERGTPITGAKYIKKPLGPVASSLLAVIDELQADEVLAVRKIGEHDEFLALTKPDMAAFSPEEMVFIADAIEMVDKHTSQAISKKSHDLPWQLAELDAEIPLYAIHATRLRPPTSKDVEWARQELASA
jgi:hypothetical protein